MTPEQFVNHVAMYNPDWVEKEQMRHLISMAKKIQAQHEDKKTGS